MYTTRLTTNLKGPTRTYDLGDKVLIVGDNEAGKSAITQSLQLAYSGAATGLLFRDEVKLASALLTMAPSGAGLDIVAEQDDGSRFAYTLPRGKRAKHSGPEFCNVDSGDIREAFSGSVDRMLTFLDKRVSVEGYAEAKQAVSDAQAKVKGLTAELRTNESRLTQMGNPELVKKEALHQMVCQFGFTMVMRNMAVDSTIREACKEVSLAYGKEKFAEAKDITLDTIIAKAKAISDWTAIQTVVEARDGLEVEIVVAKQAVAKLSAEYDLKARELVDVFTSNVQPFLKKGESLSIDLDTGYAALTRAGAQHEALSGSTEARVLAAMACALALPGIAGVLVLDDRMWSPDNLIASMEALSGAPCQVIITSTIAVPVPGWQILRV
jgi:hypothetical protein